MNLEKVRRRKGYDDPKLEKVKKILRRQKDREEKEEKFEAHLHEIFQDVMRDHSDKKNRIEKLWLTNKK